MADAAQRTSPITPLRAIWACLLAPFKPPFPTLPLLIWLYFVASFVLHPDSQIWHYNLISNDDYLYLTQAIDFLKGQSWFDTTQYRMSPPEGTPVHFSRILNVIHSAPIALLHNWFSYIDAAILFSALYPPIILGLFLLAISWAAQAFVGNKWAHLTAFTTIFSLPLLLQFNPGRVDHHGINTLLAVLAFGCSCRLVTQKNSIWPILTGIALASSLAIGLEILPVFIVICGWIWLCTIIQPTKARSGIIFALTLFITSVIYLVATTPIKIIGLTDAQKFSITYVVLTGLMASCFTLPYFLQSTSKLWIRFFIPNCAALSIAGWFLYCFPELIHGPYGGSNPYTTKIILEHATEAWPIFEGGPYIRSIFLPFIALLGFYKISQQESNAQRPLYIYLITIITVNLILAIVYQQRMIIFCEAFAVIGLVLFIKNIWTDIGKTTDILQIWCVRIFIICLAGPLTVALQITSANTRMDDILYFPMQITSKECDQNALIDVLNTYNTQTLSILPTIGQSAEIVFRTHHTVLGSPYHMSVQGNIDAHQFLTATHADAAEEIIRRRHVNLIVVCRFLENIYLSKHIYKMNSSMEEQPTLAEQLIAGNVPAWLKQITTPNLGNMLLFEVTPSAFKTTPE